MPRICQAPAKNVRIVDVVSLALILSAGVWAAMPASVPANKTLPRPQGAPGTYRSDKAALLEIQQAFERAFNTNDFSSLEPFLDPAFQANLLTGDQVAGVEGLRGFWARMKQLMGQGARYQVRLEPDEPRIQGDKATTRGTTVEEIHLPDGQTLSYRSKWSVDLSRQNGRWLLSRMESKADLSDKLTVAARVVASRIWSAGLDLRRPKARRPDWDGDTTDGTFKPSAE